ncbi:MAG TPA: hypothetical protein VGL71_12745 [Urbifossiella sp.]|jgi:predicted aspartyl protease
MIVGSVNSQYELEFHLPVRDQSSQEHDVVAILDTGFTGDLTLPTALVASLGLRWRTRSPAILANGQIQQLDVHSGTIIWDG